MKSAATNNFMSETSDPQSEPPQQGISLDELTEAFAQVMGTEPCDKPQPEETAEQETDQTTAEQDDPCPVNPQTIFEAMLFVGNRENEPLAAARAAELMRGVEPSEIAGLVDQLNRRYAADGCPYHIITDGPGYRLALRKEFHPLRNRFFGQIRKARLSQAAINTLAIVAYQQPLSTKQISRLRGKPSGRVLSQLVHRGLLQIERQQTKRRTAQYSTTDRFLDLFGLESLDDLPQSEELDRQ